MIKMMNALSKAVPREMCLGPFRLNFYDQRVVCSVCAQHRNPGRGLGYHCNAKYNKS